MHIFTKLVDQISGVTSGVYNCTCVLVTLRPICLLSFLFMCRMLRRLKLASNHEQAKETVGKTSYHHVFTKTEYTQAINSSRRESREQKKRIIE